MDRASYSQPPSLRTIMQIHVIPELSKKNAPRPDQFEIYLNRHLRQSYRVKSRYNTNIDKKVYEVEVFEIPDLLLDKEVERFQLHMTVWKKEGENFTWIEKRRSAEELAKEKEEEEKKAAEKKARKDEQKARTAQRRKEAQAAQKAAADEKKKKGGGEKKKKG